MRISLSGVQEKDLVHTENAILSKSSVILVQLDKKM